MHEPQEKEIVYVDRRKEEKPTLFENHIQTAIVVVIMGVLSWVAFKVTELAEDSAAMAVQQQNLQRNIDDIKIELRGDINEIKNELKVAIRDQYSATDARQANTECRSRINQLESRIATLEEKLRKNGTP